jgi:polysaccharide deacetylase family protein (PEP-CTERM system associated)
VRPTSPNQPLNILTVDVEDWFHILEVDSDDAGDRSRWSSLESRVEANTDALLELFAETGTTATFFVVGWVAERHPDLVRRIAASGHEIGSHSYWHEVMRNHDRESLGADLGSSRRLLQDLSGQPVEGFRAPGNSITPDTAWTLDVVVEQGFAYDSSLCPGVSSHGGYPSPFVGPHLVRCTSGEIAEIPSSTVGVAGRRIPYAGGGYLRLFPYALIRACLRGDNGAGRPANVYVHPREIDPDQPRMALPARRAFKYYVGLRGTQAKLRRLLREHRFTSASAWLSEHRDEIAGQVLDVREHAARGGAAVAHPPPFPAAPASS